jgi:hypothetical protein
MRRLGPTIMTLSGGSLEAAVGIFSAPYDLHHPGHHATVSFPPAVEYLKAMGHLLRAYVEDDAWVREMAFEFIISSMTFEAEPDALDDLTRLLGAPDEGGRLADYAFDYRHADEDDVSRYDPRGLRVLRADRLAEILAFDAGPEGQHLFAVYQAAIDAGFGLFFARVDPRLRVLEVRYGIVIHGLGYDSAMPAYRAKRSQIETAEPARPGLIGLLRHVAKPSGGARFTPLPTRVVGPAVPTPAVVEGSAAEPEAEPIFDESGPAPTFDDLTLWEHLRLLEDGGSTLLVDAPFGGRTFALLLLAPDWEHLMTFEPAGKGRWRSSDWLAVSRAEVLAAINAGQTTTVEALTDG